MMTHDQPPVQSPVAWSTLSVQASAADTALAPVAAAAVAVVVAQLNEDGGEEDDEGEDGVVSYREWQLPAADFEGQWDALHYESTIKRRLLQYASTALLFSDLGVNSQLISWNRCGAWCGCSVPSIVICLHTAGWSLAHGLLV
jgi:hypothetical protein